MVVPDDGRRFREPEAGLGWLDPVLVVCPRCQGRAVISRTGHAQARLLCGSCALARTWEGDRLHVLVAGKPVVLMADRGAWMDPRTRQYVRDFEVPQEQDSRFGVPLWLRTECCGGHVLWATNGAHIDYLESYVQATLRERPAPPSGLAWKLPTWMKEAKHRDEVLRALSRLRAASAD